MELQSKEWRIYCYELIQSMDSESGADPSLGFLIEDS